MRTAEVTRNTSETRIKMSLNLDGRGIYDGSTGIGFFDHMLETFTKHASFDLHVECVGDLIVGFHHTVEDMGIVMGKAIKEALGAKMGIKRYGSMLLPMDEALIQVTLDISGRPYLDYEVSIPSEKVGDFDTELVREFILALARNGGLTMHIRQLKGSNSHHIIEAIFKGLARAVKEAVAEDDEFLGEIPSTKGLL